MKQTLATLALLAFTAMAHGQQFQTLPDAPSFHTRPENQVGIVDHSPDPFTPENMVVHNSQTDPNKRNERNERPKNLDWRFLLAHGVYLGSIGFDIYATDKGSQMPCGYVEGGGYGAKTTGALVRNDLLEFAAITTMDYLFKRTHVPGVSYIGMTIGTIKHVHGGAQWVQHCF